MSEPDSSQWQEACLRLSHDAAVGRLFRGLLHNLNGMLQAITMESELVGLMFPKALEYLDRLAELSAAENNPDIAALRELLVSRQAFVDQGQEKLAGAREILRRVAPLGVFVNSLREESCGINEIVRKTVDFACADSFFKHKVEKDLQLAEGLPEFTGLAVELYQVLSFVLENAIDSLRETQHAPRLLIKTAFTEAGLIVSVEDSGAGVTADLQKKIFEPFFSTRQGHLGLGLFWARRLLEKIGGTISCRSAAGATVFACRLPLN